MTEDTEDHPDSDKEPLSPSDIADIDRASSAAVDDKKDGEYDPDGALASDTPEQVEAYDRSWTKTKEGD